MIKLSQRLKKIAECVPEGSRLADIGSDHALLPTYLVQQQIVPFAVAGELNHGPYEAAAAQVAEAGLSQRIHVRRGDGMEVISRGEVDVVTIAGMGGELIVRILTKGLTKLDGVSRLILQPNVGEESVRRWLVTNGWFLMGEDILEEDGRYYEVLYAERPIDAAYRNSQIYSPFRMDGGCLISEELLYSMGPYLLRRPNDALVGKWTGERMKMERIYGQLSHSELQESRRKEDQVKRYMQQIEEVLDCL